MHTVHIEFDDDSEIWYSSLTNDQVDLVCDLLNTLPDVKFSLKA